MRNLKALPPADPKPPYRHDPRSDSELAERLRTGDRTAFEGLFRAYYHQLVAVATRMLASPDVAEEIVQEAFLGLWRHRERPDFSPKSISGYLFSAVRKNAITVVRRRQTEKQWEDRVARAAELSVADVQHVIGLRLSDDADVHVRVNDLMAAATTAIEELPPRCRQAFLMRRQQGMSYQEIAEAMGIAPKTVEVQIGLALRTLRARLTQFL